MKKLKQIENEKKPFDEKTIENLRLKAKNYIPERVKQLSEKHNLNYNRVFIKNLKSRWGSCSAKNNIKDFAIPYSYKCSNIIQLSS